MGENVSKKIIDVGDTENCKADSKPKVVFVDKVKEEANGEPVSSSFTFDFSFNSKSITKDFINISESGKFISEHDTSDEATEKAKNSLTMTEKILVVQVVRIVEVAVKLTERK